MPTRRGAIKLFSLFGIGVYLHWLWFVVAVLVFQFRAHAYASPVWNAAEYLALFLIVLIHEFGHQLACRSVGGKTHDIVLWPLGGVAYVSPPQRPGAQLWSIAAGPLVNVALVPILTVLLWLAGGRPNPELVEPNQIAQFLNSVWFINLVLLLFNMMPVFPLDGGQILRSLLWFVFGRANSLLIASILGFFGVLGFAALALWVHSVWLGVIAAFILMNCWNGFRQARALGRLAKLPRRQGYSCPSCKIAPPVGEFWRCGKCGNSFDTFLTQATCPHCGTAFNVAPCLDCGTISPIAEWAGRPPVINV